MPYSKIKNMQWGMPVYVRVPFRADDKDWKKGEKFDWRRHRVDARTVERLFIQGYLHHDVSAHKMLMAKDDVDYIENMRELQELARKEGAPVATSKEAQRKLIKEHRQIQEV